MKHFIKDNIYYIEDNSGKEVVSIKLEESLNQVTIATVNEIYSGPIDLLYFKEDPTKDKDIDLKYTTKRS